MPKTMPVRHSPFLALVLLFLSRTSVASAFAPCARNTHSPAHASTKLRSTAAAADYIPTVEQALDDNGQLQEWPDACHAIVEATDGGLTLADAQDALASALGWKSWAMTKSKIARKYIKPKPPSKADVVRSIEWLQTGPLQLRASDLAPSILSAPIAYLLSAESAYESALKAAPAKYKDATAFASLLREHPSALSNYYNCVDDGCKSECGNCWVSFQNRL